MLHLVHRSPVRHPRLLRGPHGQARAGDERLPGRRPDRRHRGGHRRAAAPQRPLLLAGRVEALHRRGRHHPARHPGPRRRRWRHPPDQQAHAHRRRPRHPGRHALRRGRQPLDRPEHGPGRPRRGAGRGDRSGGITAPRCAGEARARRALPEASRGSTPSGQSWTASGRRDRPPRCRAGRGEPVDSSSRTTARVACSSPASCGRTVRVSPDDRATSRGSVAYRVASARSRRPGAGTAARSGSRAHAAG
jgi:hypothetical protein